MRESRQPQNILRQEKLGGIAGIILGVLGLILIFLLGREHPVEITVGGEPPGPQNDAPPIATQIVDARTLQNTLDNITARQEAEERARLEAERQAEEARRREEEAARRAEEEQQRKAFGKATQARQPTCRRALLNPTAHNRPEKHA